MTKFEFMVCFITFSICLYLQHIFIKIFQAFFKLCNSHFCSSFEVNIMTFLLRLEVVFWYVSQKIFCHLFSTFNFFAVFFIFVHSLCKTGSKLLTDSFRL